MTQPNPPVVLDAAATSELAALYGLYLAKKTQYDAVEEELETVRKALISGAALSCPGAAKIDVRIEGHPGALRVAAQSRASVDGGKLRADHPDIYAAYVKTTQYWKVTAVK